MIRSLGFATVVALAGCSSDEANPGDSSGGSGGAIAASGGTGGHGGAGGPTTSATTSSPSSSSGETSAGGAGGASGQGGHTTGAGGSASNGPDATAAVSFSGGPVCYRHMTKIAATPDGWVIAGYVMSSETDLEAPCSISIGRTRIEGRGLPYVATHFVAKLQPDGEVTWVYPLAPDNGAGIEDVAVDSTGAIHVVGELDLGEGFIVPWLKLDPAGQRVAVNTDGLPGRLRTVLPTGSGDLYFCGTEDWLVHTTEAGDVLAYGEFDFGVSGAPTFLSEAADGGVLLVTAGYSVETDGDLALAHYDADLVSTWSHLVGGNDAQSPHGIASDGAGGLVVVGNFSAQLTLGDTLLTGANEGFEPNGFVGRFDASGEPLLALGFGNSVASSCCDGPSIAAFAGGDWVVGGGADGHPDGVLDFGQGPIPVNEDVFLARTSASGLPMWGRVFPGSGRITSVAVAADGTIGVVGDAASALDFGGGPLPSPSGYGDAFFATFPGD